MKSIKKIITVFLFCFLIISAFSIDSALPTDSTIPQSIDVVQAKSSVDQNAGTDVKTSEGSFSGEKVWYVTYMGVIIVFTVLVILMFVFQLMKYMKLQDKPKHNMNLPKPESKPQPIQQGVHVNEVLLDDAEQEVAVIMAAIAVYEGDTQYAVTSIKPAINKKSSKVHFSSMWGVAPSHTTWRTK
ncbi:MAG TPA: OadG family protein [Petrotogaceae bacterium]|jgi:sodium pump decarboxylase gamma subunit|nr:OadG family protein [Petrotogaceae bacterium]HPA93907.1 OadG family protein [Petrotogaceae bacterium]HPO26819.1 OadG family protein [Petrotogaceae bacterium]HQP59300.1 OadG family protein [Petrotogaceae bacterium]